METENLLYKWDGGCTDLKSTKRKGFVLSDALIGLVLIGLGVLTFVGTHQVMLTHSREKQLQVYQLRQKYEAMIPKSKSVTQKVKKTDVGKSPVTSSLSDSASELNKIKESDSHGQSDQSSMSSQNDSKQAGSSETDESTIAKLPDEPQKKDGEKP